MVENSKYLEEEVPVVSEKTDTCNEGIVNSYGYKQDRVRKGETIDSLEKLKESLKPLSEIHPASLLGQKTLWESLEDAVGFGYVKREAVVDTLREYVERLIPMYTANSKTGDAVYWDKEIKKARNVINAIKNGEDIDFNGITLIKTPGIIKILGNYGS